MKKILLLFLFIINITFSQNLIPFNKLVSDFDSLVTILELTHPDPYTPFGGRMQFHKEVVRYREQIPEIGMSSIDFYFLTAGFASKLSDAHTYLEFPKQAESKLTKVCPLQFGIANDAVFVKKAQFTYTNLLGYRLLAANGISVDSLLEKIKIIEPCENIFGAYLSLSKYISSQNLFERIIPGANDHLKLSFFDDKGAKTDVNIAYVPENDIKDWNGKDNLEPSGLTKKSLFSFRYLDEQKKIVCFEFNSTYSREVIELMKSMRMDYNPTLKMLFDKYSYGKTKSGTLADSIMKIPSLTEFFHNMLVEMKNKSSEYLVVDLRENGGGWFPITTPTFYMLFGDKYFEFNPNAEYTTRISEMWLSKYNITLENFNRDNNYSFKIGDYRFGKFMGINSAKTTKERRDDFIKSLEDNNRSGVNLIKQQNGKAVYSAKIIILTSPNTFSAAFQYLYFLKEIGNAVIVGVPSRQAANSGMETTPFILQNSGLRGSISNSYQLLYPGDKEKGRLLKPDYPMNYDLFSKYNFSSDAEINYVIELIKQSEIIK